MGPEMIIGTMMPKDLLMIFLIILTVVVAVADRITKGRLRTKPVMLAAFTVGLIIGVIYVLL